MPSLRLLNEWPWGCAGDFTSLPGGSFEFTPLADNYWLTANSIEEAMRWYYKVKTWRVTYQIIDTLKNPISNEGEATFSFQSETDVVCARSGMKVIVDTGFWPSNPDTKSVVSVYLFAPQPATSQPNLLQQRHSVLKVGDSYRVFCSADATVSSGSGGFQLFRTGGVRKNIVDLYLSGRQMLNATDSFFGWQARIDISPQAEFTFL